MAYLRRDARRNELLDAMLRTVTVHGFDGASIRGVCADLGISSGNIYHLFGSAAELKSEAFRLFADREMARLDAMADRPSPAQQLHAYLASVAIGIDALSRRVWNSASQEAARDVTFARVWIQETDIWRRRVSGLLLRLAGENASEAEAGNAAWRLISFATGVTHYASDCGLGLDEAQIEAHLTTMIEHELTALGGTAGSRRRLSGEQEPALA